MTQCDGVATMRDMQTVIAPLPAHTLGPGHQAADLPLPAPAPRCRLHTLAPGASVQWPPGEPAPLLLLTEGLGKASLDGAAQRVTAPCALCVPPAAALRLCNQGSTPMRLLALRPIAGDPGAAAAPAAPDTS
jgi:hypothetical protein